MITALKRLLKWRLSTNLFDRGVVVLAIGAFGGQGILLLAAPILTRLYSLEDFGLLAIYSGTLSLIVSVSSLSYQLAIPISQDDEEAANIVMLSLLMVCVTALLTLLVMLDLNGQIAELLNITKFEDYLFLLPIGVLLAGFYQVFNYWNTRNKNFSEVAKTRISQSLTSVVIQICGFKFGAVSLLLGQISGQSAGTARLSRIALLSSEFKQVSWKGVANAASRYRRFPIFSAWGAALNTAGVFLPTFFIITFFGPAAAGLYGLAIRVLSTPIQAVSGAVSKTFFSYAKDAKETEQIGRLVSGIFHKLILILSLPMFIISLVGPNFFGFVFGEKWAPLGELVRYMAIWIGLQFVTSPLTAVFFVYERQHHGLVFQVLLTFFRILGLGLGAWSNDLITTIVLFSVCNAICYLGCLIWIFVITKVKLFEILLSSVHALIFGSIVCAPLVICELVFSSKHSWAIGLVGIMMFVPLWAPRFKKVLSKDLLAI